MIINLLINLVLLIIGSLFVFFPEVTLNDIPYVGIHFREILINTVGYWNSAVETLPYLQIGMTMFIYVILPFEITLLVLKVFLGHRLPAHLN